MVLRIALGQLNTTVGDLAGNVGMMIEWAGRATELGADLVVFPELAVTGYPPEDLVLRPEFVGENREALEQLAAGTADGCAVITGFVDRAADGLHNAAAFLRGGAVDAVYHKAKLPNYGVFDERRYFVPGTSGCEVAMGDLAVGISVCEDAWEPGIPWTSYVGTPVVVNINGSPYHLGKTHERAEVISARARETGAWIVYVNTVGGQDELVFDGGSMVVSPAGEVACLAAMFEEELAVAELDVDAGTVAGPHAEWPTDAEQVYRALELGTRDYVRKNGFGEVVLGLSGGVDSALVAAIAADALGADAVRVMAMPSMYSSTESLEDALEVARRLGLRLDSVPIGEVFDAYGAALREVLSGTEPGLAEENIQARIRGNLLMAVSNRFGSLVLATGNKSEYAVGYSTLYGDMAGGFAPIKDVPKTLVYELCRWRNTQSAQPPIPDRVLTKPPSAELRPNQKDTDSLPPYEELDPVIEAYVERDLGVDDMVSSGMDRELVQRVVRMVDRAEYKRRQAAPGVKITPKAFGRDRRMPITNRYPG